MYSSCVVFNSANQNEQPERFAGNSNNMECSNAAAERHILQSFRDEIGKCTWMLHFNYVKLPFITGTED